jgi:hypothetical protein
MLAADVGAGTFSLASAALMLAGCGGSLPPPLSPSAGDLGLYAFEAPVPSSSGQILLQGTFEIAPDTVILLLEGAECRPGLGSSSGFGYSCRGAGYPNVSGMSFGFERARPLRRPSASVRVSIPSTREVCHRWMETETGRHCMSWNYETTYRTEHHSVRLKITPKEPGSS